MGRGTGILLGPAPPVAVAVVVGVEPSTRDCGVPTFVATRARDKPVLRAICEGLGADFALGALVGTDAFSSIEAAADPKDVMPCVLSAERTGLANVLLVTGFEKIVVFGEGILDAGPVGLFVI